MRSQPFPPVCKTANVGAKLHVFTKLYFINHQNSSSFLLINCWKFLSKTFKQGWVTTEFRFQTAYTGKRKKASILQQSICWCGLATIKQWINNRLIWLLTTRWNLFGKFTGRVLCWQTFDSSVLFCRVYIQNSNCICQLATISDCCETGNSESGQLAMWTSNQSHLLTLHL